MSNDAAPQARAAYYAKTYYMHQHAEGHVDLGSGASPAILRRQAAEAHDIGVYLETLQLLLKKYSKVSQHGDFDLDKVMLWGSHAKQLKSLYDKHSKTLDGIWQASKPAMQTALKKVKGENVLSIRQLCL